MNDPNGLVYLDGTYHIFFQHNPYGSDWGNMSWGHATSRDLLQWEELPVAIPFESGEQIYSGSVVIDRLNSTGFGSDSLGSPPPLVAIYTSVDAAGGQAQSLAYSTDGGGVWQKYSGNPVLDRGSRDFRDPKVFAFEPADGEGAPRWIMVAVEATERQVLIYSSTDLRNWVLESTLGPLGPEGVVWECPDLFPLPIDDEPGQLKWVLLLSTNELDPAGAPVDSSMTALVGEFDGASFVPDDLEAWPVLDHGRDFYAAVTFYGVPAGRKIALAWASNWQYAAHTPTTPWRGAMSLPRELGLARTADGIVVRQTPARETRSLTGGRSRHPGAMTVPLVAHDPVHLDTGRHAVLDVAWTPAAGADITIDVFESIRLRYEHDSRRLSCRRADPAPSVHAGFASNGATILPLSEDPVRLLVVVDGCVVEVFAADGTVVFTDLVFGRTETPVAQVRVAIEGGSGELSVTPID